MLSLRKSVFYRKDAFCCRITTPPRGHVVRLVKDRMRSPPHPFEVAKPLDTGHTAAEN